MRWRSVRWNLASGAVMERGDTFERLQRRWTRQGASRSTHKRTRCFSTACSSRHACFTRRASCKRTSHANVTAWRLRIAAKVLRHKLARALGGLPRAIALRLGEHRTCWARVIDDAAAFLGATRSRWAAPWKSLSRRPLQDGSSRYGAMDATRHRFTEGIGKTCRLWGGTTNRSTARGRAKVPPEGLEPSTR